MEHLDNKRSQTLIDRKQCNHCYVVDGLIIFHTHFSHVHIVSNNLRIVSPIWGDLLLHCKRNVCVSFIVLLRVNKIREKENKILFVVGWLAVVNL